MDRKSFIIGIALLGCAFGLMVWQPKRQQLESTTDSAAQSHTLSQASEVDQSPQTAAISPFQQVQEKLKEKPIVADEEAEVLTHLENDFIKVTFSNKGGAIKTVDLKQYPAVLGSEAPFVFNAHANTPALSISLNASGSETPQLYAPLYELVQRDATRVLFKLTTLEGLVIYRGYTLMNFTDQQADPYLIRHEMRFENLTDRPFEIKNLFISLGSLPATPADIAGEYLNFGHYNNKSANFIRLNQFADSKGFLGIGAHKGSPELVEAATPVVWASIKNQFFTAVLTPEVSGSGIWVKPVELADNTVSKKEITNQAQGITGALKLNLGKLDPHTEKRVSMDYYVGPKEYTRLDHMGQNQDLVMQFGIFGFISKLLLTLMLGIHKLIPNWGATIILLTLIIKLLLWPLTTAQVRSSKRMAKIQEPLKALKDKFKDNPQKLQSETMKLFKENRVNPAAGCLPLFVQLPIFLGLYFMLRTCSELRFANFLWIKDLSVPDTLAYVKNFPINLLPLIMGVTMFWQMRVMPSPMTDNVQRKIFQFMPFMFLFICYNFPSGLVLYWTVQNILTVVQQMITGRMKDPSENLPVVVGSKKPKRDKRI